jgi:hypothetical protein
MSNSPSLSNTLSIDNLANDPEGPKYFFQEKYAPLNVRGNFLTLCACPKNVELGEWLAHQSKLHEARIESGDADAYLQLLNNIVYSTACSRLSRR